jgi:hypothetical protein
MRSDLARILYLKAVSDVVRGRTITVDPVAYVQRQALVNPPAKNIPSKSKLTSLYADR